MSEDDLEDRVSALEDKVQGLKERRNASQVPTEVGDLVTVIVEDANKDNSRDAVGHIDGMATFIKTPGNMELDFGDTVRCKVSDIQDRQMVAVAMERKE